MIREIPVDPEFQAAFLTVVDSMPVMVKIPDPAFPGTDRKIDSGEQRKDNTTGYPTFEVSVAVKLNPTAKADVMAVKVSTPVDPIGLVGQKPAFGGLRAAFHSFGQSGGWMFSADTVSSATPPSARRAEPASSNTDNGKAPVTASA